MMEMNWESSPNLSSIPRGTATLFLFIKRHHFPDVMRRFFRYVQIPNRDLK